MEGAEFDLEPRGREPRRLLDGLTDAQRFAVTSTARVNIVRAGAGSGKTRVVTRRIAWLSQTDRVDPRRVLALTFTRAAATELRLRLRRLDLRDDVRAGTFHAIALATLRGRWEATGTSPSTLVTSKSGIVQSVIGRSASRVQVRSIVTEIEWAKARRVSANSYVEAARHQGRQPAVPLDLVATTYAEYEASNRTRRRLDFDDVLTECARLLQNDHAAREAFRWAHRHVFVDEFQDVNPLQFGLLKLMVGDEPDLFVVGDVRQAIYGWNGAEPELLAGLHERYPHAVTHTIERNHRSTDEILRVANTFARNEEPLTGVVGSGTTPAIHAHPDDTAEAAFIAHQLRSVHSGRRRWRDMAVLVRTNAQVPLLVDVLNRHGVPTQSSSATALLEGPEVGDALDQIDDHTARLSDLLPDLETVASSLDADDLWTFVRLGREHVLINPRASLEDFRDELVASGRSADPTADAVDVRTFHAAKGLEWDIVHLAGLESGLVPHHHSDSDASLAEERRLLYVAITRARRSLDVHWAGSRTLGTRTFDRQPSPFLLEFQHATTQAAPEMRQRRNAVAANRVRSEIRREVQPTDSSLRVSLEDWRRSRSRANHVAPETILSDAALDQIVHARPTTREELAELERVGTLRASRFGDELLDVVRENHPKD